MFPLSVTHSKLMLSNPALEMAFLPSQMLHLSSSICILKILLVHIFVSGIFNFLKKIGVQQLHKDVHSNGRNFLDRRITSFGPSDGSEQENHP
jgi:hypothetical protein